MLVIVARGGRPAPQSPGPAASGNEQKAAFVEEYKMSVKFSSLFLYGAIGNVSSVRWPFRRAGGRGAREPGNSNAPFEGASRRGWDDTGRRTPFGSPARCVSASIGRWENHRPARPEGESPIGGSVRSHRLSGDDPEPVGRRAPCPRPADACGASAAPNEPKRTGGRRPPRGSFRPLTRRRPGAVASLTSPGFHVVSCAIYRHIADFTCAKLNKFFCS